jgi:hypothetical protein
MAEDSAVDEKDLEMIENDQDNFDDLLKGGDDSSSAGSLFAQSLIRYTASGAPKDKPKV